MVARKVATRLDALGNPVQIGDVVSYVGYRKALYFGHVIGLTRCGVRLYNLSKETGSYNAKSQSPIGTIYTKQSKQVLLVPNSEQYRDASSSLLADLFPDVA